MMSKTLLFIISLLTVLQLSAQMPDSYIELWDDPRIRQRIEDGIRQNRMDAFTLVFQDNTGHPVNGIDVEIEQIRHDFYFGANAFMVKGFKNQEEDALYEKHFAQLFNFATIPFYWPELEPEPGHLRFEKDSEYIYRRPPPDLVLEFCKRYDLTPKGHTLVWDNPRWSLPDWLPPEGTVMEKLISKRIEEIAGRYGHEIMIWDVANEVTDRHPDVYMPRDFAYKAFRESERVFPNSSVLTLNFTTNIWRNNKREYSPEYLLIDNLLLRNAKVDAIGMQYHNFNEDEYWRILKGEVFSPLKMFNTLDNYSDFGLPIHITEITIAALSEKGPQYQAIMAENLYRLWFSHPGVEAIIWWNLVDGTAAPGVTTDDGTVVQGEDKWRGGLLNRDFSKKPAYEALDNLINKEWRTHLTIRSENNVLKFNGFYGTYQVMVKTNGRTFVKELKLPKKGSGTHLIVLEMQ